MERLRAAQELLVKRQDGENWELTEMQLNNKRIEMFDSRAPVRGGFIVLLSLEVWWHTKDVALVSLHCHFY